MPERLQLTKNAQFFRTGSPLSDEIVQEVLDAAADNITLDGEFIIDSFRQERLLEEQEFSFVYSVKVFPSTRPVYFLDDDFEDIVHAFILVIEVDNYIAILKKSCANISDTLEKYFTLIGSEEFSSSFSDEDVEFQKMALRNMTISDRAMRTRSYEAANLKGLLSTHSAGRSIPFYFKLRQGSTTKSISGSGRVVESSSRESIDDIGVWVRDQINLIESPISNNFLDAFASKIDLSDVLELTKPNAVLIESSSLFERIEKDDLALACKTRKGKKVSVSSRIFKKLECALESVYELDDELNIVGGDNSSWVRKNKKTLTLHSKTLSKFRVVENGKEVTLQKFIIKNGLYSITFDDPKYMYFMGSCFEDSSGVSEIDNILEILQPMNDMSKVHSEKGEFDKSASRFSEDSMFSLVEAVHQNDDYIFCDDLGDEWADHITFNKRDSNICFVHSKHGDPSTSASNLHDVVGQGIKNLGNMYFGRDLMLSKLNNSLSYNYKSSSGIETNIARIRKGDPDQFEGFLNNLLKDYKLNRRCVLSCSFISKSDVKREFLKIKNKARVRGHVTQLFWIISSFAHAAKDMNTIPLIYCNK
ncbi:hypothetical protein KBTX_02672 [wastewater metagenome]|uniref:Uncharacterized protein n=2 Tax=unclassified sequences TaxID=12908 RepID=A0A5B8RC13_9ZZZZ|nr:hypothetical protein [Arhodomonas sp. KWT]QEA06340.1 hypothetical protein KBTEX_02672 [uncultured organism]